jgi:hypothetical protein
VIEFDESFSALIVLPVDSSLVYGPPVDGDRSVGAVLTQDRDFGVAAALLDQVAAFFKLKCSGL